MIRLLTFSICFVVFLGLMGIMRSCDREDAKARHDEITRGCVMVGTIEGYRMGREGVPAQEQWRCGDITKTVNAVQ